MPRAQILLRCGSARKVLRPQRSFPRRGRAWRASAGSASAAPGTPHAARQSKDEERRTATRQRRQSTDAKRRNATRQAVNPKMRREQDESAGRQIVDCARMRKEGVVLRRADCLPVGRVVLLARGGDHSGDVGVDQHPAPHARGLEFEVFGVVGHTLLSCHASDCYTRSAHPHSIASLARTHSRSR
eukprot:3196804-Rhodomonas_salina.1